MSYALVLADQAAAKLEKLRDSLPSRQRADAIEAVDKELSRLCSTPLPRAKDFFGRPAHEFRFQAGGVTHHWGATYRLSEDETSLVITHLYKVRQIL